jgi:hypothetical protein
LKPFYGRNTKLVRFKQQKKIFHIFKTLFFTIFVIKYISLLRRLLALPTNISTSPENPDGDKRSSLLLTLINYSRKKFFDLVNRLTPRCRPRPEVWPASEASTSAEWAAGPPISRSFCQTQQG